MTFEASMTVAGGGVTAILDANNNRVSIIPTGAPDPAAVSATLPRLLQHLADRARLPLRHGNRAYYPHVPARGHTEGWE